MTSPTVQPYAAALLAGGQSRRMGQDKALLDWQGEPLWQVQLQKLSRLQPLPARLLLSCREEQGLATATTAALSPELPIEIVPDPPDNQGPLPALLRCLELTGLPTLVLAVDMPWMTTGFLQQLLTEGSSNPNQGLVYQSPHAFQPLAAFYPPAVISLLRNAVQAENYRLQSFVQAAIAKGCLKARPVTEENERCFLNLNRPEDMMK